MFSFPVQGRGLLATLIPWLFFISISYGVDIPDLRWMPEPLQKAALRHQDINTEEWAFSVSRMEKGMAYFETYDPSLEPDSQWQLWMVNGKPASPKDLESYAKKEKGHGKDLLKPLGVHSQESKSLEKKNAQKDLNPQVHDREISGPLSFSISEETDQWVEYDVDLSKIKFEIKDPKKPQPSRFDNIHKLIEHFSCRVRVSKEPAYVEFFEFRTLSAFSPMTGVKVKNLRMKTDYQLVGDNDEPIIKNLDFSINGRALALIPFDIVKKAQFSDFRKVISEKLVLEK